MEGESVLDTLFDEECLDGVQDVEMLDVEEGELTGEYSNPISRESHDAGVNQENQKSKETNSKHKKKRKKNKRKKSSGSGPNITNVNRFVPDVCKRLREKKSYLVWTAVGCLGVSALNDLLKEVEAIQACGGQKTVDGRRFRTGGGILWNIIKSRDPNAYKEIMKKGKEYEKQFKLQLHGNQALMQPTNDSSQSIVHEADQIINNQLDHLDLQSHDKSQLKQTHAAKRAPVRDRIRVPVTYDDLLGGEDPKDEPS